MKTVSGILVLGKREVKALELVAHHVQLDIDYGWDGTYGGHNDENKREVRQYEARVKKAELGVDVIKFILTSLKK